MLVGPRGVTARPMHDAENGVSPDQSAWIDRRATLAGVRSQPGRVNREDSPVHACRCSAVELGLIEFDAFLVLGPGAGRGCSGRAGTGEYSVASGLRGRIQRAVKGGIVEYALGSRRTAAHEGRQSGKRIGRLGSGCAQVIDAVISERGEVGAIGHPGVDPANSFCAITKAEAGI